MFQSKKKWKPIVLFKYLEYRELSNQYLAVVTVSHQTKIKLSTRNQNSHIIIRHLAIFLYF